MPTCAHLFSVSNVTTSCPEADKLIQGESRTFVLQPENQARNASCGPIHCILRFTVSRDSKRGPETKTIHQHRPGTKPRDRLSTARSDQPCGNLLLQSLSRKSLLELLPARKQLLASNAVSPLSFFSIISYPVNKPPYFHC